MYMETEMRDALHRLLIVLTSGGDKEEAINEAQEIIRGLLGIELNEEDDELTEDDLRNEMDWGYGDERASTHLFRDDEHFRGDVWVSFKTHDSSAGGFTDCELRIINTKEGTTPYTWWVTARGTYTNAADLLEELKKDEYETQGTSQS